MNKEHTETARTYIVLEALEGNQPVSRTSVQEYLAPHVHAIEIAWWLVFSVTIVCVLVRVFRSR